MTAVDPAGERQAMVDRLAAHVAAVVRPHPVRVTVDGPDATGKTTLADELAARLAMTGREVIRASLDDFGRPRSMRYRAGRDSADGYYRDAFDLDGLVEHLLDPLGPGGTRRHRTAIFDLDRDVSLGTTPSTAAVDAILVVDGVFLLRPELVGGWDLRIELAVGLPTVRRRALDRDVPRLGSRDEVEARYRARYLPAQAAYLERDRPLEAADVVVENEDPVHPRLLRWPGAAA